MLAHFFAIAPTPPTILHNQETVSFGRSSLKTRKESPKHDFGVRLKPSARELVYLGNDALDCWLELFWNGGRRAAGGLLWNCNHTKGKRRVSLSALPLSGYIPVYCVCLWGHCSSVSGDAVLIFANNACRDTVYTDPGDTVLGATNHVLGSSIITALGSLPLNVANGFKARQISANCPYGQFGFLRQNF